MDREHKSHIFKLLGLVLTITFFSIVIVLFLAMSAEEDGMIRDIMMNVPILRDLTPHQTVVDMDDINTEIDKLASNEELSLDFEEDDKDKDVEQVEVIDLDQENNNADTLDIQYLSDNSQVQYAEQLFANLRLKEAKEVFLTMQDQDPVANYYLALLAAYERNATAVRAYIKRANELSNSEMLNIKSKEIIKAFDEFNLYNGSTEDHLDVLVGRAYLNVGQVSLGVVKLKDALAINPRYKDAYVLLGAGYMMLSDYEQAENYLTEALPTDRPEPHYYLGLARFNQGKYQEAILAFNEASELGYHPEIDLRKKLGESLMSVGRYEEALIEFDRVIDINPLNPDGYYEPIWICLKAMNNGEKALYYADLALSSNPSSALTHDYMGWVYLEASQYDMAKNYLDAALNYDSNLASANYHMGEYYLNMADFDTAISYFQKVIESHPDSAYGNKAMNQLKKL